LRRSGGDPHPATITAPSYGDDVCVRVQRLQVATGVGTVGAGVLRGLGDEQPKPPNRERSPIAQE
jgi:hypothetical protein